MIKSRTVQQQKTYLWQTTCRTCHPQQRVSRLCICPWRHCWCQTYWHRRWQKCTCPLSEHASQVPSATGGQPTLHLFDKIIINVKLVRIAGDRSARTCDRPRVAPAIRNNGAAVFASVCGVALLMSNLLAVCRWRKCTYFCVGARVARTTRNGGHTASHPYRIVTVGVEFVGSTRDGRAHVLVGARVASTISCHLSSNRNTQQHFKICKTLNSQQ